MASSGSAQLASQQIISLDRTSALIFDLDGTMVDNMRYHQLAWQELLHELGYDWSIQEIRDRVWGKNEEIFERLFPGRFTPAEIQAHSLKKELRYIDIYRPHIQLIDGLEVLLQNAKKAKLALAIATAAPRVCVEFVMHTLELAHYVELVVQADEVTHSKPHPETFLTAAARLGVSTDRCIIFEDAPVGVRAAHAAEISSYVVLSTHPEEEFTEFSSVLGFMKDFRGVHLTPTTTP